MINLCEIYLIILIIRESLICKKMMIRKISIFLMDYELLLEDYRRSKDEEFGERVELEGWEGNFDAESLINLTGPVHTVKPTADCMRKCKVHVLRFVFSPARQEARAVLLPTLVSLSLMLLLIGAVVKCIRS